MLVISRYTGKPPRDVAKTYWVEGWGGVRIGDQGCFLGSRLDESIVGSREQGFFGEGPPTSGVTGRDKTMGRGSNVKGQGGHKTDKVPRSPPPLTTPQVSWGIGSCRAGLFCREAEIRKKREQPPFAVWQETLPRLLLEPVINNISSKIRLWHALRLTFNKACESGGKRLVNALN